MPSTPATTSPSRTPTRAWRLNRIVWSLMLVLALAAVACMWGGGYGVLVPLLLLPVVAGVGLVTNLALFCRNAALGRFRQALLYGAAVVLLAVVLFWLRDFVNDIIPGKMGG